MNGHTAGGELGGGRAHKNAKGKRTSVCKNKTQTKPKIKPYPHFLNLLPRLSRMFGLTHICFYSQKSDLNTSVSQNGPTRGPKPVTPHVWCGRSLLFALPAYTVW